MVTNGQDSFCERTRSSSGVSLCVWGLDVTNWSSNSGAVSFNIQVGDNPRWRGSFYCQKHEVMLTTPESAPLDFHTLFEHHNAMSGHD